MASESYYTLSLTGATIDDILEDINSASGYIYVDGGNVYSREPVILGSAAPTTSTVGVVKQVYIDTTNQEAYVCTAITPSYTWLKITPAISWGKITGAVSGNAALTAALALKQDVISDLSTIRSGAAAGATAVQPATTTALQAAIDALDVRVTALEEATT